MDIGDPLNFWRKVDIGGPNECWPWNAGYFSQGYGCYRPKDKSLRAHRVAFTIAHGAIPKGALICHDCDNPACCNPAHLWAGTHRQNMIDMVKKDRVARGSRHGIAKLTEEKVKYIRNAKKTAKELARELGVCMDTIYSAKNYKHWGRVE